MCVTRQLGVSASLRFFKLLISQVDGVISVRRYPDFAGRFLCTAGNCKIAA
jgi:hypothetical protein